MTRGEGSVRGTLSKGFLRPLLCGASVALIAAAPVQAGNRTQVVRTAGAVAPVANSASISTSYNTAGSTALSITGTYASAALASNPSHGTTSVSGANSTYTPTTGSYGADSFTYTGTGPAGTSSPATASVTVAQPAAPTVGNVSLSTAYNTAGSATLLPNGAFTSLSVASGPSHGSASISGTTATFTPTSGYYGSDSFTYTATGPGGTTDGTVTITVAPAANPTAPSLCGFIQSTASTVSTAFTPLKGATDPAGYALTVTAASPTTYFSVVSGTNVDFVKAGGSVTSTTGTYTLSNGQGGSATRSVPVYINRTGRSQVSPCTGRGGGPPGGGAAPLVEQNL